MRKNNIFYLLLSFIAIPQTALAHFESPHEPFWHEPMHFVIQHYIALMLIGIGAIAIVVAQKKKLRKSNEKNK